MAITKKTTIGEVLNQNIETAKFCMVHGTNADELVAKLNAFIGE